MSLIDNGENGLVMPVAPMGYGSGGSGGFCNGFGGDASWLILFIILALGGGWGRGFGGGGFGGGGNDSTFPWLVAANTNTDNLVTAGFNQASTAGTLSNIQSAITSGFGDTSLGIAGINQNICQTGSNVASTVTNGFANAETANNARQIANMQQAFANQTAMNQGFNNIQSQFAECCCENRLSNCQTQNIIQNEGNATRFADANNTRDLLVNQTANTQAILDKLCQLELDGKNTRIADLERQLTMANLSASQIAQTAQITAGQNSAMNSLVNELRSCPIPCQPVYGSQPIFTCQNNNNGCGCGCGNGF